MVARISDPAIQPFEKDDLEAVRSLAPQCVVLLKNDGGILPLEGATKIALFGSGARQTIKGGSGSGDVNVRHFVTIEEGLEQAGVEITTKDWLDQFDRAREAGLRSYYQGLRKDYGGAKGLLSAAWMLNPPQFDYEIGLPTPDVTGTDTAVYVVSRSSGEGMDRKDIKGDLRLTDSEVRDIRALSQFYRRFVLVLNVGGLVDLSPVADSVASILLLSQLGSATGEACADVLLGKQDPSGRLAMTWAAPKDYRASRNFGNADDNEYREGIFVGYRGFDTAGTRVDWPFGFGLSYTSFAMTAGTMSLTRSNGDAIVSLPVHVQNTGKRSGRQVAQVYVSQPQGTRGLSKPYQVLAGFAKTRELQAGSAEDLTVSFPLSRLASYDAKTSQWVLEAGRYVVRLGDSSRSTHVAAVLDVSSDLVTEQDHAIGGDCGFEDETPAGTPITYDGEADEIANAAVLDVPDDAIVTRRVRYSAEPGEIPSGHPVSFRRVLDGSRTLEEFVGGLSDEQLARVVIGRTNDGDPSVIGAASYQVAGAAGETTDALQGLAVPPLTESDGPAGLRLARQYAMIDRKHAISLSRTLSLGNVDLMFTKDEQHRLGLDKKPDVPEGAKTYWQNCAAIPIGTALAQAFDPDVARQAADIVGIEMERFGVDIWLAPAMNIQRSPLSGRDFEYYSEDPLVSGLTAAGIVEGVQSHPGRAVTLKHFAANSQETNRMHENNKISERALREIYLRGFEITVKSADPLCVMTSYNLINGVHANSRHDLVTEVLRDEWGFSGFVMTDWFTTMSTPDDEKQAWPSSSAAGCVKAGNDVTMPGADYDLREILDALHDPTHPFALTRADLQADALHVLGTLRDMKRAQAQTRA